MRLRSSAGGFPGAMTEDRNDLLDERVLGEHMVSTGKISRTDFDEVLAHQRVVGNSFAEAAVALGKLDPKEIDAIVSRHSATALLDVGDERISPLVRAAFVTGDPYVEQLRTIRSKIIASTGVSGATDWATKIAVIGIGAEDETSVLSANLAVVFAQLGSRTLLIDCGLTDPVIDSLFRIPGKRGLSQALQVQSPQSGVQICETAIPLLAIVPAGEPSATSQSFLHKQALAKVIDRWSVSADHIIANLPSMQESALSLGTILSGFSGVFLVTCRGVTKIEDIRRIIDSLDAQGISIFGTVIS